MPAPPPNVPEGPLYQQVAEKLRARILEGAFVADAALPNEDLLAAAYGVSRVTIRKTLEYLAERNLIRRQQGKGTFIDPRAMRQQLSGRAQTIVEALGETGVEPHVTVLDVERRRLPAPYPDLLGLEDQEAVVLRRLYSYQDDPIALVTLYVPLPMSGVAHALARPENSLETTYSIYEEQMGLVIKEATHVVRTKRINEDESAILKIPVGSVCLTMNRMTYSTRGTLLELMNYTYAPDRMQFEINLPRQDAGGVIIRKVFHRDVAESSDVGMSTRN
jgi:GntR family transcriptional regulator